MYQRGLENGVKDLKVLNSKEIKDVEPYCEVNHAQENIKMLQYIAMEILLKLVGYVTVDRGSFHHSMGAWETEDMIHDSINTVFSTTQLWQA